MITIISPATTMNFNKENNLEKSSIPYFFKEADYLMDILKTMSVSQIRDLMNLSEELGNINKNRYENYGTSDSTKLQSMLAFDGEVFNCMNVSEFTLDDYNFSNDHFRILSGLYGVLSPFDEIEPYRLEMKAKLINDKGDSLYKFWKNNITKYLINEISKHNNKVILNLASSEYVKAIDLKTLNQSCDFINVEFKDYND
ncbi:MAG: YaaA family protein, partial [Peptostreptococcaceae bacterium]